MSTKIKIKIHPNSSQEKIEDKKEFLEIWIKEKPIDGKANDSLIKILKKHFNKEIKITSGFNSRIKIIEIEN